MKECSGAWELYWEKAKILGYCLPPTDDKPQIAIFANYGGKTKGEPSFEYLTEKKKKEKKEKN